MLPRKPTQVPLRRDCAHNIIVSVHKRIWFVFVNFTLFDEQYTVTEQRHFVFVLLGKV